LEAESIQFDNSEDGEEGSKNPSTAVQMKETRRAIFSPEGEFIEKWDLIMLFLLAYTAVVTTYEIAFIEVSPISLSNGLFVANRVVDFGFVCDIIINFNLAYYNEANMLITATARVRSNYLKGWFTLDIISMLPFGMLGELTGDEKTKNMKSFRLIRLLRLIKLTRMLRASRIVSRIVQKAYFKMSTWAFIHTFGMLAIAFHWSSCIWMILANVEGASPNWQTKFLEADEDEEAYYYSDPNATATSRFLKARGAGSGSAPVAEPDWYNLCGKFTLAIFGVWSFEPPEPYTVLENWFTVALTVFAASFYAYLAGIIVELVYRRSESSREINSKMDGLLTYLETIKYPMEKRQRFKKFFWQIKPYFMHNYFQSLLPHLSPELNGELALFNHGKRERKRGRHIHGLESLPVHLLTALLTALLLTHCIAGQMFQTVSWLNCEDDEESIRFKTQLSSALGTKAYCLGEHIIVLSLHFIIEGLIGCRLQLLREGSYFGEMQCLSRNVDAGSARALTFTACAVMETVRSQFDTSSH
jgi:hypothetical protein